MLSRSSAHAEGDDTRSWGPLFVDDVATYFLTVNRSKRSITLDLKGHRGRAKAAHLKRGTDVMVENFRTGRVTRYGLGYDEARRLNPRVIFCPITGIWGRRRGGPARL